jgi:adenine-specific DNA-methyltransferase
MQSYKHKSSTRPLIPSKEEAGMEESAIQNSKSKTELPLNPVTTRGQDPELYWMNKYGPEDNADALEVDIRSLYRHEHISPELLIRKLYRQIQDAPKQGDQLGLFAPDVREIFGNTLDMDEFEKVGEYYRHQGDWSNRLIQGDSLLTMTSLLEREGFAGKVQMMYFDPPYGIKYGSNWQLKLHDRDVKDGSDDYLSSEPEQIKAFRDTWELGIHSYLTYLRDRLLVARELLTESGSCFVQISDENVHLVRCLMDEVFGSGNFVSLITVIKRSPQTDIYLPVVSDYLLFYAKDKLLLKYNSLYSIKEMGQEGTSGYSHVEYSDGTRRRLTNEEINNPGLLQSGGRIFTTSDLTSSHYYDSPNFEWNNKIYTPGKRFWSTSPKGLKKLASLNRLHDAGNTLRMIKYFDDFPVNLISNVWADTTVAGFTADKKYVVQTSNKIVQRCLLMTTDPGDLVLDPTCGSGTTAYVAEQWGRRWITLDTSRIALNIAKTRLMTAVFPYYHLYSNVQVETTEKNGKIVKKITPKPDNSGADLKSPTESNVGDDRQGFVYEEVPHITLKSLANDEPPSTETLYDKPYEDKSRLRVAGPFTVETLQNYEPQSAESLQASSDGSEQPGASGTFEERVFEHLKATGVMNGAKNERAVFSRVERIGSPHLHAEGYFQSATGERKAYLHIGPQFGTVSKQSVNEAVKECRSRGDADWLIILGFSFESDISNQSVTMSMGSFEVTKVRMHDDLLQEGLTKKDKKAASFVTIGEPDVAIVEAPASQAKGRSVQIEIQGLDIYDPIRDEVRARSVSDIAYWMVDDDYDGSNFIVQQVFFCGGDKDEFNKWKRGLSDLAKQQTKKNAERTLRLELDEEAFDLLYGFRSHPIERRAGRKIAVRVVSQFGEESMKVLNV